MSGARRACQYAAHPHSRDVPRIMWHLLLCGVAQLLLLSSCQADTAAGGRKLGDWADSAAVGNLRPSIISSAGTSLVTLDVQGPSCTKDVTRNVTIVVMKGGLTGKDAMFAGVLSQDCQSVLANITASKRLAAGAYSVAVLLGDLALANSPDDLALEVVDAPVALFTSQHMATESSVQIMITIRLSAATVLPSAVDVQVSEPSAVQISPSSFAWASGEHGPRNCTVTIKQASAGPQVSLQLIGTQNVAVNASSKWLLPAPQFNLNDTKVVYKRNSTPSTVSFVVARKAASPFPSKLVLQPYLIDTTGCSNCTGVLTSKPSASLSSSQEKATVNLTVNWSLVPLEAELQFGFRLLNGSNVVWQRQENETALFVYGAPYGQCPAGSTGSWNASGTVLLDELGQMSSWSTNIPAPRVPTCSANFSLTQLNKLYAGATNSSGIYLSGCLKGVGNLTVPNVTSKADNSVHKLRLAKPFGLELVQLLSRLPHGQRLQTLNSTCSEAPSWHLLQSNINSTLSAWNLANITHQCSVELGVFEAAAPTLQNTSSTATSPPFVEKLIVNGQSPPSPGSNSTSNSSLPWRLESIDILVELYNITILPLSDPALFDDVALLLSNASNQHHLPLCGVPEPWILAAAANLAGNSSYGDAVTAAHFNATQLKIARQLLVQAIKGNYTAASLVAPPVTANVVGNHRLLHRLLHALLRPRHHRMLLDTPSNTSSNSSAWLQLHGVGSSQVLINPQFHDTCSPEQVVAVDLSLVLTRVSLQAYAGGSSMTVQPPVVLGPAPNTNNTTSIEDKAPPSPSSDSLQTDPGNSYITQSAESTTDPKQKALKDEVVSPKPPSNSRPPRATVLQSVSAPPPAKGTPRRAIASQSVCSDVLQQLEHLRAPDLDVTVVAPDGVSNSVYELQVYADYLAAQQLAAQLQSCLANNTDEPDVAAQLAPCTGNSTFQEELQELPLQLAPCLAQNMELPRTNLTTGIPEQLEWPVSPWQMCRKCPVGSFSAAVDATECFQCPPGQFANSSLSTSCTPCPNGTFSYSWGTAQCKPCWAGTFADQEASTACDVCPTGWATTGPGSTKCYLITGDDDFMYSLIVSFSLTLNVTNSTLSKLQANNTGIKAEGGTILRLLIQADTADALRIPPVLVRVSSLEQVAPSAFLVNVSATMPMQNSKPEAPQEVSADTLIQKLVENPGSSFQRTSETTGANVGHVTVVGQQVIGPHSGEGLNIHAIIWPTLSGTVVLAVVLFFACTKYCKGRHRLGLRPLSDAYGYYSNAHMTPQLQHELELQDVQAIPGGMLAARFRLRGSKANLYGLTEPAAVFDLQMYQNFNREVSRI